MAGYLDAAVMGTVIVEPQIRTSSKGTAYARFLLVVGEGDHKQFCWVCAFGHDAERVAPLLKKGGSAYAEGGLTSEIYQRDGKPTVSLSIAARRVEVLNQIGKARPKKDTSHPAGHDGRGDHSRAASYRHPQHERPFNDAPFDYEARR
jgi:single-stranded DNA-binding protein